MDPLAPMIVVRFHALTKKFTKKWQMDRFDLKYSHLLSTKN